MLRRILQPLWVLLALIFLIEAWLWDHLEPIVARVVAWIPLRAFKVWLAGIVTRYGRSNIRVSCPASLEADDRLTVLLEESVGPIVPSVGPSQA